MPAETPMHHSAAKTASAARSFRIEVPPLGSRMNYGQVGDWFRSPPSSGTLSFPLFRDLRVSICPHGRHFECPAFAVSLSIAHR